MTQLSGAAAGINGETRLYAIIGHPVAQVRSPMAFNPLFRAAGMNAVLVALEPRIVFGCPWPVTMPLRIEMCRSKALTPEMTSAAIWAR